MGPSTKTRDIVGSGSQDCLGSIPAVPLTSWVTVDKLFNKYKLHKKTSWSCPRYWHMLSSEHRVWHTGHAQIMLATTITSTITFLEKHLLHRAIGLKFFNETKHMERRCRARHSSSVSQVVCSWCEERELWEQSQHARTDAPKPQSMRWGKWGWRANESKENKTDTEFSLKLSVFRGSQQKECVMNLNAAAKDDKFIRINPSSRCFSYNNSKGAAGFYPSQ